LINDAPEIFNFLIIAVYRTLWMKIRKLRQ
jgi:hypothetical protein